MGRPRRIGLGLLVVALVVGVGLGVLERAGLLPQSVGDALTDLAGAQQGEVTRVTDGDTITVHGADTIRVIGIDAMDSHNEERVASQMGYYGMSRAEVLKWSGRATTYVREQVGGRVVALQYGPEPQDGYGRTLAYVHTPDGTDLGLSMIRQGLAAAYRKFEHPRREVYLATELAAREQGVGLWEDATRREW
jgi:endonuclease YncB( thermonuclease family)